LTIIDIDGIIEKSSEVLGDERKRREHMNANIYNAMSKLAAEAHENNSWYAGRKFESTTDELIVQTIFYTTQHFTAENAPHEQYLEAAQSLQDELDTIMAIAEKHAEPVEIIEALWLRNTGVEEREYKIEHTYNTHYGVYITFYPDHVYVDEQDHEYTWRVGHPSFNGVSSWCEQIYQTLNQASGVLASLPWGNLRDFGGRKKVIENLYAAVCLNAYAR